jgi:hypothetical protein
VAAIPALGPIERKAITPSAELRIPLQRKLAIGAVDDPLEREADRVAAQVMRMPDPAAATAGYSAPVLRRKCACEGSGEPCAACGAEQEDVLRRKSASPTAPTQAPAIVHEVLRSSGKPLDAATRAYNEPRFGHDFSRVRVHTDAKAAESARDVNAYAYTAGQHVVFGAGTYTPETDAGRKLLAHELTHTIQQNMAVQTSAGALPLSDAADASKRETETAVAHAPGVVAIPPIHAAAPHVARQQPSKASTAPASAGTPSLAKAAALNVHLDQQDRVAKLIRQGLALTPAAPGDWDALFRNACQFIVAQRFTTTILTPTHDTSRRRPGQYAYFDRHVHFPDRGGDYDTSRYSLPPWQAGRGRDKLDETDGAFLNNVTRADQFWALARKALGPDPFFELGARILRHQPRRVVPDIPQPGPEQGIPA